MRPSGREAGAIRVLVNHDFCGVARGNGIVADRDNVVETVVIDVQNVYPVQSLVDVLDTYTGCTVKIGCTFAFVKMYLDVDVAGIIKRIALERHNRKVRVSVAVEVTNKGEVLVDVRADVPFLFQNINLVFA